MPRPLTRPPQNEGEFVRTIDQKTRSSDAPYQQLVIRRGPRQDILGLLIRDGVFYQINHHGLLVSTGGLSESGDIAVVTVEDGESSITYSIVVKLTTDTDGNGLLDGWKKNGRMINGRLLDLTAMGADPNHKDIFVEADFRLPATIHTTLLRLQDKMSSLHMRQLPLRIQTAFQVSKR